MTNQGASGWIRAGVWALPLYGLLTLWTTFTHQPDPNADFEAYARYVSTTNYLVGGRAGRLALFALLSSVAGNALILTIFGMSTFATPAVGRAYLAGQQGVVEVNQDILGVLLVVTALLGGLLYSVGTILFGIAIWRS